MNQISFKLYSSLLMSDFYVLKVELKNIFSSKKFKVYDYSIVLKSFHQFIILLKFSFLHSNSRQVLIQTIQKLILEFFQECFLQTDFKIRLCSEKFDAMDEYEGYNILLCSLENPAYLSTNKQIYRLFNKDIILQVGGDIFFKKSLTRIYRIFALFDNLKKTCFFIYFNKQNIFFI